MEEDILNDFRNIVEESRIEDRIEYYLKLRNVLDLTENLIKRNKELEKENKKMKANNLLKLNKEINENIQVAYGGKRYNTEGIVIENYIPKSKVREILQDIEETIQICKTDETKFFMSGLKNSLQSILQEGDK